MTERYRNHPIVICRSLVVSAILFFIIGFNIASNREEIDFSFRPEMLLLLLIPVLLMIYYTVWWRKTFITLEEDHAVAESWVLYGRTKVIPYGKVASVNEVKGIIGRMIGVTTLRININSAKNAARSEISFTFRDDLADYVAKLLKYGAEEAGVEDESPSETDTAEDSAAEEDCIYRFGTKDAVMFGIFGSNTWSLIITLLFGVYSYVSAFFESAASFISIMFMILSGVVPMVRSVIRHGNFRIYRTGDRIRIIHGMAAVYDTTFDVSRVNAVTVKRTLFARLLGKCCIEAEVVGINAQEGEVTPTVTLLIPESELVHAMQRIFPEFITDYPVSGQSRSALVPHLTKTFFCTVPWVVFFSLILFLAWRYDDEFDSTEFCILAFITVIEPLILVPRGFLLHRVQRIGYGESMFTAVTGVVDSRESIMQYSKVQTFGTVASPAARKRGLAKLSVGMLSSMGAKDIALGFFPEDELTQIGEKAAEQSGRKLGQKN